jgi:hypothetical protein
MTFGWCGLRGKSGGEPPHSKLGWLLQGDLEIWG